MGRTIAYKRFRKSYYLYYKLQRTAYVEQKITQRNTNRTASHKLSQVMKADPSSW